MLNNSNTNSSPLLLALVILGGVALLWQPPYHSMGLPLQAAMLWTAVQAGSAVMLIMTCLIQMLVVPEWRRWQNTRQLIRRQRTLTGSEAEDLFLGPGDYVLLSGLDRGRGKKLQ